MANKKKRFLTVYTVSYADHEHLEPLTSGVIGSWLSRGDAIKNCTDYVMERLVLRADIRFAMFNDSEHDDLEDYLKKKTKRSKDELDELFAFAPDIDWKCPKDVERALREYVKDELGGQGCYRIERNDGVEGAYLFSVEENDVESRDGLVAWTCLTSGTGGDAEFDSPTPEVFMSCRQAEECAVEDYRMWYETTLKHEPGDATIESFRGLLRRHGWATFYINKKKARMWEIWQTPICLGCGPRKPRSKRRVSE